MLQNLGIIQYAPPATAKTYACWDIFSRSASHTYSNKALTLQVAGGGNTIANVGMSSGDWYWELKLDAVTAFQGHVFGISKSPNVTGNTLGFDANGYGWVYWNGGAVNAVYNNGSVVASSFGVSYATGDTIGMAYSSSGNTLKIYKNNTLLGTVTGIGAGTWYPAWGNYSGQNGTVTANFGATAMTYSPPAGYNAGVYVTRYKFNALMYTSGVVGASGGTIPSIDTTGANILIVGLSYYQSAGRNLTDNKGNTWIQLTQQENIGQGSVLYYCINPTVGTGHTFTTTSHYAGINVLGLYTPSGLATYHTENGANANASGSLATGSVTPTVIDEVSATVFGSFNGVTPTSPTGYGVIGGYPTGTAEAGGMAMKLCTTTGAENPTWNDSGSSQTASVALFKP